MSQPSAEEKANASVGLAEFQNFKRKYDPLLQQMRDRAATEDFSSGLRGRANADTMQALTSNLSYQGTQNVGAAGDAAQALQGQLGIAETSAKKIENTMSTNVLGTARGQAADAQTGMATASRLATSEALTRAKAKQDVRSAQMGALGQVAGAFMMQGAANARTRQLDPNTGLPMANGAKGSFFKPVDAAGNSPSLGQRVSNFFGFGGS